MAEDTDEYLRASVWRDAGAALGDRLNLADGILGQGMNVLVLLTTNEETSRLHPASVRPGRCLAEVEFSAFDPFEASRIGPGNDAHHAMTLAELLEKRGDLSWIGPAVVVPRPNRAVPVTINRMIKVGGREVDPERARTWVDKYLNGEPGQFGYPSYDGYRTNEDPNSLCDGDLLAPTLLNVQVKIKSFADLCACRDDLEAAVGDVPVDVDLADADSAALERREHVRGPGRRLCPVKRPGNNPCQGRAPKAAQTGSAVRRASPPGPPRWRRRSAALGARKVVGGVHNSPRRSDAGRLEARPRILNELTSAAADRPSVSRLRGRHRRVESRSGDVGRNLFLQPSTRYSTPEPGLAARLNTPGNRVPPRVERLRLRSLAGVPFPGPPELGRSLVVNSGGPAGTAWASAPRVTIDDAVLKAPAEAVAALHEAWANRRPTVIDLRVDPGVFRQPKAYEDPLWRLGAEFEEWGDRLHFFVWANTYDARSGGAGVVVGAQGRASRCDEADVADVAARRHAGVDRRRPARFGRRVHRRGSGGALGVGRRRQPARAARPVDHHGRARTRPVRRSRARVRAGARHRAAGSGKTACLTEHYRHLLDQRRYERGVDDRPRLQQEGAGGDGAAPRRTVAADPDAQRLGLCAAGAGTRPAART